MSHPIVRGYRGSVPDVRALVDRVRELGAPVQLVRADRVYGRDHLLLAAELAARAVAEGRARANDVATETAVYAAGERQIGRALAFIGLTRDVDEIAAVVWDDGGDALDTLASEMGWARDDAVLDGDARSLAAFGVSDVERAMLPPARWGDLVLERVALVDVLKA